MNEDAMNGVNPYMKPMGRNSLLSRPAPLAVHRPVYTPNEPDEAEDGEELISALGPTARRVAVPVSARMDDDGEREAVIEHAPSSVEQSESAAVTMPEPAPRQISFFAREETPASEGFVPNEEPAPAENIADPDQTPADPENELPVEETVAEPAEEPAPRFVAALPEELPAEEAVEETAPEAEPLPAEDLPEQPSEVTGDDFDYNAYYAAYWAQWQASMEAQQNRACTVCPLMGQLSGQNASVCLVPVIVTDQQGQPQEPQAVLRMAGLSSQAQSAEPAPAYVPETSRHTPVADDPLPQQAETDFSPTLEEHTFVLPTSEKVNDDDEYLGDDAMADEDMPTPQTIPAELPDLGLGKKKKSFGWLWGILIFLLALVVIVAVGLIVLSSTGRLEGLVEQFNLPEVLVDWLKKFGLL